MKRVVLRTGVVLGITFAVAAVFVGGIRLFSDGPVEILPGGPMSGTVSSESFPGFGDRSSLDFAASRGCLRSRYSCIYA